MVVVALLVVATEGNIVVVAIGGAIVVVTTGGFTVVFATEGAIVVISTVGAAVVVKMCLAEVEGDLKIEGSAVVNILLDVVIKGFVDLSVWAAEMTTDVDDGDLTVTGLVVDNAEVKVEVDKVEAVSPLGSVWPGM